MWCSTILCFFNRLLRCQSIRRYPHRLPEIYRSLLPFVVRPIVLCNKVLLCNGLTKRRTLSRTHKSSISTGHIT